MIAKIKQLIGLQLTADEHRKLKHKLVAHWGQKEKTYSFDFKAHKIVEVCKGEFKGHCWIEEIK